MTDIPWPPSESGQGRILGNACLPEDLSNAMLYVTRLQASCQLTHSLEAQDIVDVVNKMSGQ